MNLISNSITPNEVQEEQRNGDRFLVVRDVPFIRPMELSGGYVPERYVSNTIQSWAGEPLTANHPRNDRGEPVPARTKLNEVGVGQAENPYYDGTWGRADLAINADRAQAMGGHAADIVEKIEAGDPFDVSSQYLPKQLPPGEYDGEHRANVEGIQQPDSIALLPHKPGKCSRSDGCGINPKMAANSAVRVPMTPQANAMHGEDMDAAAQFDEGDLVRWQFGEGFGEGRIERIETEPGAELSVDGGTRIAKADDPAVLLSSWTGNGFDTGDTVKLMSNLEAWPDPPEDAMSANAMAMEVTNVDPSEIEEWTDSEWDGSAAVAGMPNPSDSEDATDALDASHLVVPADADARENKSNWKLPFRAGPSEPTNTRALVAIDAALSGARDGVEGLSEQVRSEAADWVTDALQEAPSDLFGSMDGQTDNSLAAIGRRVTEALGLTAASNDVDRESTMPAESGVGNNSSTMERDQLIEEITANSALTKNALAERCNDGLQAIHDDIMSANNDNDDGGDGTPAANDNSEEYVTRDELDEFKDDLVDELSANREQSEKEELAEGIVANSAEYEDAEQVMEDYPTKAALETKRDSLNTGGVIPGQGATANADGIVGGDSDIDVDSGVLTE